MTSNEKFWLILWGMIIGIFAVVVVSCTAISCHKDMRMAELGYQEDTVQGSSMHMWRKVSEPIQKEKTHE